MPIEYAEFVKQSPARAIELEEVRSLVAMLRQRLEYPDVARALAGVHVLGASSHAVQSVIASVADPLGFSSEKTGLFCGYQTAGLRPDYYRRVGASGILMEVERGKTLPNNMDLLDLWKCHICREADYLFLVVPQVRHRARGKPEPMFPRVAKRLATFFEPQNYVNVEAAFLFGY